jgi:hypothetical protein
VPVEAECRQPRRPVRRHPPAVLAAVELPLELPLVFDPPAEPRVLGPAHRHVAVAVLHLIYREPRELRLPASVIGPPARTPADRAVQV